MKPILTAALLLALTACSAQETQEAPQEISASEQQAVEAATIYDAAASDSGEFTPPPDTAASETASSDAEIASPTPIDDTGTVRPQEHIRPARQRNTPYTVRYPYQGKAITAVYGNNKYGVPTVRLSGAGLNHEWPQTDHWGGGAAYSDGKQVWRVFWRAEGSQAEWQHNNQTVKLNAAP